MTMLDLSDKKFGRLAVIERNGTDRHGRALWSCRCDCGALTTVSSRNLVSGNTSSCGCLRDEKIAEVGRKSRGRPRKERKNKGGRPVGHRLTEKTKNKIARGVVKYYRERDHLSEDMLRQYKGSPEAVKWLERHKKKIDATKGVLTTKQMKNANKLMNRADFMF